MWWDPELHKCSLMGAGTMEGGLQNSYWHQVGDIAVARDTPGRSEEERKREKKRRYTPSTSPLGFHWCFSLVESSGKPGSKGAWEM